MNNPKNQVRSKNKVDIFKFNQVGLAVFSLCALVATFFAANSNLGFQTKIAAFFGIVLLYLFGCLAFYVWQKSRLKIPPVDVEMSEGIFSAEIETKLLALEEANEFFGASLQSADMFRLVSSRVKEIIPFAGNALFLVNEDKTRLRATFADGENAASLAKIETDFDKGLAGKTFIGGKAQIDETLLFDRRAFSAEALRGLNSAISVPLFRAAEIFGVLILYGKDVGNFDGDSVRLLEAVGARVAPLFLSSLAFEKSLSNALTDSLTNLPNERAFYLVLENQIAESQRFREMRALTILTVDIKNFDELNQKYGHATGDRILAFAAVEIKGQLRRMDFLARQAGDEFLAVLPTADEQITGEIVGRVEKAFVSNPFAVSRSEKINLALNFGAATFGKDGETVSQLLQHARLRKQQSKSTVKSKVLWFPKEYVN